MILKKVMWTYSFRLLIREDTSLSTSCEITVHFERVPGTSLVRIHPVFTWMQDKEERGRISTVKGYPSALQQPSYSGCIIPIIGYYCVYF